MCLIGIAWQSHPRHALVLAANRDEFHARPSAAAGPWKEHPHIFGGRDIARGGSWLAVSTHGRLAAVTNVRRMATPDPRSPSRGTLVSNFLTGSLSAREYAESLRDEAGNFSGFNLLIHDGAELLFLSNTPEFSVEALAPGFHTVSNASLDTPWPKATRISAALKSWAADSWESFTPLFKALGDRTPAPEAELPNTGIGKPMEKMLSPPFIVSPNYGTRCSTVVTIGEGKIDFAERRFEPNGLDAGKTDRQLVLGAPK
jgi:uncharacterized protein with NRDE domain